MDNVIISPQTRSAKLERLVLRLLLGALAALSLLSFAYAGLKIIRLEASAPLWYSGCVVLAAACMSLLLFRRLRNASPLMISLVVFFVALLPRVLFSALAECVPVSDFANYRQFAVWLAEGNRQAVADVAQYYQLTSFAGLAVLNYGLSLIFTPTVAGMQLCSAVLSSLICVLIYHLGARFRKPCGIAAALAYAWYPGSIIASQILTNQHGATLFALLSLLALLRASRARRFLSVAGFAVLSGALLVVSHFFHPSSITTVAAVICFLGVIALQQRGKGMARTLCSLACFLLAYQLLLVGCTAVLHSERLLPEKLETGSFLAKVAVGLNPETEGAYSAEDYAAINAIPPETRDAYTLDLIGERISHPVALLKTLAMKTFSMWVRTDNLFLFYEQGIESGADADTAQGMNALGWARALQLWDALFVALLYAGAAVGLFCVLRKASDVHAVVRLLAWVFLGWAWAHILSEIQPRYRYYAIPMLAALWGISIEYISAQIKKRRREALTCRKTNCDSRNV